MLTTKTRDALGLRGDTKVASSGEFSTLESRPGTVKHKDRTNAKEEHADDAVIKGDDGGL